MEVLLTVSTAVFAVLAILLVVIILLQSDKSAGMGILGGSSQTTFGSSTADVITKTTMIMVALFMIGSLGLAILESYKNKSLEKDLYSTDSKNVKLLEGKSTSKKIEANDSKNPGKQKE